MNAVNIEELFEDCVQQLSAGASLEEVLAKYPVQAEELRPMLQAVLDLQQFSAEIKPSQAVQMRSRAQFLTTAVGMASPAQKQGIRFSLFHLRLAASSAIVIAILAAVLLIGTGFASADALPGDVFYPVKIMVEQMQINMVQDPPARLQMENVYDDRRQEEVARLTKLERVEEVKFSGYLQKTSDGKWQIGSVQLVFPAGSGYDPANFEGAYVEISGKSDSEVVEVQSIEMHLMVWDGILQNFNGQSWQISGLNIQVTQDTQINGGQPVIGATVRVVAVRPAGNQFTALSLTVKSLPTTTTNVSPQPTQTSSQESGESGEVGENKQPMPTSVEASPSPSPQPESHPTQSETESENTTRTKSSPTPTPTRKSDEESRPTRTPTSASNATKTPTRISQATQTATVVPDATSTREPDD